MPHPPDYYEILCVAPNADNDTLRRAYRRLAFAWHPDRRPGDANAAANMRLLNEAHDVLSNPSKRRDYDLQRAGPEMKGTKDSPPRSEPPQRAQPPDFRYAETVWRQAAWAYASTAPKSNSGQFVVRLLWSLLTWPVTFVFRRPLLFSMIVWWGFATIFSVKDAGTSRTGTSKSWWQRFMREAPSSK